MRVRTTTTRRSRLVLAASLAALLVVATGAYAVERAVWQQPKRLASPEAAALRTGVARNAPEIAPAANKPIVAAVRTAVDGDIWSVTAYESVSGQLCAGVRVPGEGQGIGCYDRDRLFVRGPLRVEWGSRQESAADLTKWDAIYVNGFAAPGVDRVEIVFTDCSRETAAIGGYRLFLHVTGKERAHNGTWPHWVVARTPNGRVLDVKEVTLGAPDPTTSPPKPSGGCGVK